MRGGAGYNLAEQSCRTLALRILVISAVAGIVLQLVIV